MNDKTNPLSTVAVDPLVNLLRLIDSEYDLVGSWIGNGCEHGFKPAKSCPNADCNHAEMHRLWDELLGG